MMQAHRVDQLALLSCARALTPHRRQSVRTPTRLSSLLALSTLPLVAMFRRRRCPPPRDKTSHRPAHATYGSPQEQERATACRAVSLLSKSRHSRLPRGRGRHAPPCLYAPYPDRPPLAERSKLMPALPFRLSWDPRGAGAGRMCNWSTARQQRTIARPASGSAAPVCLLHPPRQLLWRMNSMTRWSTTQAT